DYLDSVGGESVVAFKDEDVIKVHVHTFDPGKILSEMRKYGEFLTVKIENMNLQHSENSEYFEKPADKPVSEHKKIATVAVATGEGAVKAFEDAGVDAVVSGGQTMNTSINDFLETFEKIDADYIFVYPNNPNIIMAASLASENYDKAKIVVIPTKTVSEGYSAVSMLDTELEPSELEAQQKEVIGGVKTVEVTYAVRDTLLDGVEVKKDDYICISAKRLLSADKDRIAAVKAALEKIEDFSDKQLMTVFTGKGIDDEEYEELCRAAEELNPLIEIFKIDGGQEVYNYIIGIE
ncbi:MAG: DAK2 domain-containing protein, partial [Clostridia bacterium]|nr:DAK2 domain-containing protein [Clostridia bacterium]